MNIEPIVPITAVSSPLVATPVQISEAPNGANSIDLERFEAELKSQTTAPERSNTIYDGSLEQLKILAEKANANASTNGNGAVDFSNTIADGITNFRSELNRVGEITQSPEALQPEDILKTQFELMKASIALQFFSKIAGTFSQDIQTLFRAQ